MGNPFKKPKAPAPIIQAPEERTETVVGPNGQPTTTTTTAPPTLPAAPARSDDETLALAEEQRKRFAGGGGRSMTYLTGGGLTQGSSAIRFLGGAART